uniref:Uncharacterized protein n=1 Tax=Panagrolaimus sp. JU765 TaxID=591449 RepID=A0AC34RRN5_9BILA
YLQQSLEYWINVDINVAIQLNSFIQRVNQSFEQEVFTWEGRQKFLADYITEWMVFDYEFTCKYFLTIKFGDFGSLFDFIFCEHFEVEPEVTFAPEATTQVLYHLPAHVHVSASKPTNQQNTHTYIPCSFTQTHLFLENNI